MPPWLSWLLLGLVAGSLAKFLVPGRDPSGCIITVVLGIVGAFLGGFLGAGLGWGGATAGTLELRSVALATLGAVVILLLGRLILLRRRT